jgi:hypothetical protein
LAAPMAATSLASADAAHSAHPHYIRRLRALAQLQGLNAALLSHDSATAVLQALCDRRDPAAPPIRARRLAVTDTDDQTAAVRRELGATSDEPVRHRRVELMCRERVLSRADNWYLPGRLTAKMNHDLETTDTPFGVVARPLGFQRRTLSARLLFEPLPPGWESQPASALDQPMPPAADVLQHRAVLQTPDGRVFTLLVETYSKWVIAS